MKSLIICFLILSFSISFAGDKKKYGKEITLKDKTSISKILANPDKYVGKKVLVEGTVVGVCSKRGCWIELASDKAYEKIKVKVKDGEIVFPIEEQGKKALVEGEVYKVSLTKEQALEKAKHEAEEHGTECDTKSITGPEVYYQIKGIGAVIE